MPPTPPPDIDLEAGARARTASSRWDPDTLFLTHFGPFNGARPHFQELMDRLAEWSRIVRRLVADDLTEEQRRGAVRRGSAPGSAARRRGAEAEQYSRAGSLAYSWQGLARYWRKRAASGTDRLRTLGLTEESS